MNSTSAPPGRRGTTPSPGGWSSTTPASARTAHLDTEADPTGPPPPPRWSQREQLTSHQFQRRRLMRSLAVADPETAERPDRRLIICILVGLVIGALALAVMAVIGIIKPGSATNWRQGNAVIVEKETGTRYVLDDRGVLHPALNFASAVLFLGGQDEVVTVSRGSLDGAPRGAPIGILGAPDALPTDAGLVAGPWTACSQVAADGDSRPTVTVDLGGSPSGRELVSGTGVLVEAVGTGERYLVVAGRRHLVGADAVLAALGWPTTSAIRVSAAWADTVPPGPDLRLFAVPGEGQDGPSVAGRPSRLGEVFELPQSSDRSRFWVLTRDGLAVVPRMAATLILANPNAPAAEPIRLTAQDAAAAPLSAAPGPGSTLPDVVPQPAPRPNSDQVAVCASTDAGAISPVRVRLTDRALGTTGGGIATGPGDGGVASGADVVRVRPGAGALVAPAGAEGVAAAFLVTDQGVRHPLASAQTVRALGFGEKVKVTPVPPAILALLPAGPTLDQSLVADESGTGGLGPVRALGDGYFRPGGSGQ